MEQPGIREQLFGAAPPMEEVVRHYYCIQTDADLAAPVSRALLPNYELMLVFNFGTPIRSASLAGHPRQGGVESRFFLLAPLRRTLRYELDGGVDSLILVFTLDGFYRLTGMPVSELAEEGLNDLASRPGFGWLAALWQAMHAAGPEARIELLNRCLAGRTSHPDAAFRTIRQRLPSFEDSVLQPAKAIAAEDRLTQRTVQARFQKYLGFSPKEMLRYLRFRKMIGFVLENRGQAVDLLKLAVDYGYHDQSHLAKDFGQFLGTTPRKFIRDSPAEAICTSRPGNYY